MGLDLWMLCYLLRLLVFGLGVKVSAFGFKLSEFVEVQLFISEPKPRNLHRKSDPRASPCFRQVPAEATSDRGLASTTGVGKGLLEPPTTYLFKDAHKEVAIRSPKNVRLLRVQVGFRERFRVWRGFRA